MEDLGTAIGLGTRMTPDRDKPLTTGANTFIKLEMGKVAAAAKAAAAKQKALDAIGSSLKLTGEPVNKHLQKEMSHATNQGYFDILNSKSQIDANNNWTSAGSVIKSVKQESNREEDIVNGRQKGLLISDLAVQGLNNGDDKEIEKAKSDEGLYGTYTTIPTKGVSSKEDKYTIINHNPVYANTNLDNDLEKDVKSYIDSKPLTSTGKTVFGHGEGSRTLTDTDLKIISERNAQNEQNATTIIDANIGKAREMWAEKQKFYAEKGIDINVDKKAGHQAKTEIAQDLFMDNLRGIAKTKFDYLTPPQSSGVGSQTTKDIFNKGYLKPSEAATALEAAGVVSNASNIPSKYPIDYTLTTVTPTLEHGVTIMNPKTRQKEFYKDITYVYIPSKGEWWAQGMMRSPINKALDKMSAFKIDNTTASNLAAATNIDAPNLAATLNLHGGDDFGSSYTPVSFQSSSSGINKKTAEVQKRKEEHQQKKQPSAPDQKKEIKKLSFPEWKKQNPKGTYQEWQK